VRPILQGILHGLFLAAAFYLVMGWLATRPQRRARRQLGPPVPPQNLRLEFADGRVVPVECVYAGIEQGPDGGLVHHWQVVTEVAAAEPPQALDYDVLPSRTVVSVAVHHVPGGGP
jgi:hypothetical protein